MDTKRGGGETWSDVIAEAELAERRTAVVRVGKKQLAVFQTEQGVFACNNRCPHEGYPLAEGGVDGACVLTCNWHNWKFELATGDNLLGGDALRTYPTQVRDGRVYVDTADPPVEETRSRTLLRLREAMDDDAYDRIAREVARLLRIGTPIELIFEAAVASTAPRLEFGTTHAFAALPDWLSLYDALEHEADRLACLVEPLAHMARDTLREPSIAFATVGSGHVPYTEQALLDAIESEERADAEALIASALAAGVSDADLKRTLTRAALSHYADFGHSLIYTQKAFEAIARLGHPVRAPLLQSLVRSMVYAQREDLIPEFRGYAAALACFGSEAGPVPSLDALTAAGVDGALSLVAASDGSDPVPLYRVLLQAAAHRVVSFDTHWAERFDRPVSDNINWLDFSHALTFAHAARDLCSSSPELWPAALLQMACFVGRTRRYVDPKGQLAATEKEAPDFEQLRDAVLDHGSAEPIVSAHGIKTLLAVRREFEQGFGDPLLGAALKRFLNSPMKRRHVRRTARQSLAFVARED